MGEAIMGVSLPAIEANWGGKRLAQTTAVGGFVSRNSMSQRTPSYSSGEGAKGTNARTRRYTADSEPPTIHSLFRLSLEFAAC